MVQLRDIPLADASVPLSATFGEAARALCAAGIPALAVLDERGGVAGLFTADDLVAGLFPPYLRDLRHTAFAPDELAGAARKRAAATAGDPVERHMREPVVVEADTSILHAAETLLHCAWAAVAVVEDGRFVGMLAEVELCRRLLPSLGL